MTRDEALAKLKQMLVKWEKVTPAAIWTSDGFKAYIQPDLDFISLSRAALPALVRLGIGELERHYTPSYSLGWSDRTCVHCNIWPCATVVAWIKVVEEISKVIV